MLDKQQRREEPEINGSSLADIAFLLLIFFLVVTTIDVDAGIGLVLPPIPDDIEPPPVRERNLLNILVNAQGMVLLDEQPAAIAEVRQRVREFVDNPTTTRNSPSHLMMQLYQLKQTGVRLTMFILICSMK